MLFNKFLKYKLIINGKAAFLRSNTLSKTKFQWATPNNNWGGQTFFEEKILLLENKNKYQTDFLFKIWIILSII